MASDTQGDKERFMGFSEDIKKSNTDEWYTYAEDVQLIVPYLKNKGFHKILCPFDKRESKFVEVLSNEGFKVYYSHIDNGVDFFNIKNLSDYDAVVSNPPFSKRQSILQRLFDAKVPFALIINMNGLFDRKSRWNLFKDNDFELLIPKGRMKFFNDSVSDIKQSSPNFQSIFLCSGIANKQIEFIDTGR